MAKNVGEHKEEAINAMLQELGKFGLIAWNHEAVRSKYPNVPKATWYRWKNEAAKLFETSEDLRKEFVVQKVEPVKPKAKPKAPKLPKRPPKNVEEVAQTVVAVMPAPPSVDEVMSSGIPAVDKINQCIARAEAMMRALQDPATGAVKNPDLYLKASKHILESIKTAAAVATVLHDAARVSEFHQAIIKRLEQRDPAFALDVLNDLQEINQAWMGIT